MKIGMPSLVEHTTINQSIDLCTELNLSFIELNMNLPYNQIQNIKPEELRKITKETNIEFTMHMPDEADLGSFYESVRGGYVSLFSDTLDWAHEAGVKLLNMHIIEGAKMTLPDKKVYIYDQYRDQYQHSFIESIKELSSKSKKRGIILAIENSNNFGKNHLQKVLDEAIRYPNIKLTWDTGHDAVSKFTDKKYLMKNRDKIVHMHLHDAIGNKDHQIPFDGELNIEELIAFAKQHDITMLIEVKTAAALRKSVQILREKKMI